MVSHSVRAAVFAHSLCVSILYPHTTKYGRLYVR
nr:MAG TPA: hypothetical protein [Caudoviricetes sp.]